MIERMGPVRCWWDIGIQSASHRSMFVRPRGSPERFPHLGDALGWKCGWPMTFVTRLDAHVSRLSAHKRSQEFNRQNSVKRLSFSCGLFS